ncbi:MAG TPA: dephospho-CoA kinase [Smithellaceae bacterium]|nr:dephospho-CoA kinase [Smithellaceae bacterium]
MLNVGLTGGIACGKSTVARMFVDLGGHLIDFDRLAHEVQEPGRPAWHDVVAAFGRAILRADGTIDREKLGAFVFNSPEKMKTLNDIVHPRVYEEWRRRLDRLKSIDPQAIVFSDVPLLFEGGKQILFDLTVLVMIAPEAQIDRLMARNNLCQADAELRLACQMPIEQKIPLADIVVDNSGGVDETKKRVAQVWHELLEKEKKKRIKDKG